MVIANVFVRIVVHNEARSLVAAMLGTWSKFGQVRN